MNQNLLMILELSHKVGPSEIRHHGSKHRFFPFLNLCIAKSNCCKSKNHQKLARAKMCIGLTVMSASSHQCFDEPRKRVAGLCR